MNLSRISALVLSTLPFFWLAGHAMAEANVPPAKSYSVSSTLPVKRDIEYVLSALGSVESLNSPTISAETTGRITSLRIDVGGHADAGQLLATIDNALHEIEVAEAGAEYKRQQVMLENQRREVERLGRLARSQSVSRDQLEDQQDQLAMLQAQVEVARNRWQHARHLESMTRVTAPHGGSVARRHVSLGDYVSPGQPLFDLVSVDRLRARVSFPEQDAANIRIGQEVYLQSPAAADVLARGKVSQINPRINVSNRAIEVLVEFDNPGGWYPGGSVNATLVFARKSAALTVPRLGVVTRSGRDVVFVVENNQAVARPIKLGWQEPEWVEVIDGISDTDRIVVEGAALLSDGSLLTESGAQQ